MQTPFGKGAVREFAATMDAQAVYRKLHQHYATGVTASIQSQALEEEIIGMRLDQTHKKGCEAFLNVWHLKVQELDSIRDTSVPGPQKRIWLTSALQTHAQMSAAITQASTMEHTMAGLSGTSLTVLDFHSFFDLCTTTAKHIDKINQIKSAKQREINLAQQQAGRGGRGGRGGRDATTQGRGEGRGGRGRGRGTNAGRGTTTHVPRIPT